jgi:hypothetical protein
MALVVYGFPTQVQALQFEWAWQHPEKSKAVRAVAAALKKHQKTGTAGKVGAARFGWLAGRSVDRSVGY